MGEYGYGVDQLLSQMFGQYTDGSKGSKALQSGQASGVNNVQDLLKLLLDPQLAMYSGSYDPSLVASPQAAPMAPWRDNLVRTTRWMNSGIPGASEVAAGFINGTMDPATANQWFKEAALNGQIPGVDTTEEGWQKITSGYVTEMWDEVNKNQQSRMEYEAKAVQGQLEAQAAPRDDVFAKAGLPSPQETYTAETVPMDSGFYERWGESKERAAVTQAALDDYLAERKAAPQGPSRAPQARPKPTVEPAEVKDPNVPTFANSGAGKTLDWLTNEDSLIGKIGAVDPDEDSFFGELLAPFKGDKKVSLATNMAAGVVDAVDGGQVNPSTSRAASQDRASVDRSNAFMQAISGDGEVAKRAAQAKKNALVSANVGAQNAVKGMDARAAGMASGVAKAGRTPLNDALQARLAMLRSFGIA